MRKLQATDTNIHIRATINGKDIQAGPFATAPDAIDGLVAMEHTYGVHLVGGFAYSARFPRGTVGTWEWHFPDPEEPVSEAKLVTMADGYQRVSVNVTTPLTAIEATMLGHALLDYAKQAAHANDEHARRASNATRRF